MVQESQFYTAIDHWKLNSTSKSDGTNKQNRESYSMHAQIGHNIPEQAYGGSSGYSYSMQMPSIYNQNSFSYVNNSSSNAHEMSSVTPVPQQAYPGISMSSYQLEHNQYLSTINQNKIHTSGSSTADSNTSNVSELDINRNPVKKRRKPAPTIATGRRNLKNETMLQVAPEEAERRDKRRERNRKSAQRCRERKIEKKETLQKEINSISQKSRKYLDLAEEILKAWKDRLRSLDEKLPGHNFKPQFSVAEFEKLIEACSLRNNENSEAGDTGSPRSSVVDPIMINPIKQDYVLGQTIVSQNTSNSTFMTCGKVEQYCQNSYINDLQTSNSINSHYDPYHHHHSYGNESGMGFI